MIDYKFNPFPGEWLSRPHFFCDPAELELMKTVITYGIGTGPGGMMTRDDLRDAFRGVGGPQIPGILYHAWTEQKIDVALLREHLGSAWFGAWNPHKALTDDQWAELFGATGFCSQGRPATPWPLRLYRGATLNYRRGWSWTSDPNAAYASAHSDFQPGSIWVADVPVDKMLCHIGGPMHEYVINTEGLNIGRYETMRPEDHLSYWDYMQWFEING